MAINDECEKYGFNAYQLAKAVIPTAGMTLEFLWGHEEGLTFKDLVSSFNFGLRNISGEKCLLDSLGLLMDTGLVNNIGAEAAPVYKAVPMTSNEAEIIKDIFEKNIEDEKKVKQAVLAYVFKTTETKWGTKLLNTIRQTAKMMTAKKRGKVVLIYDNKWVPEEQRNLREFQSLERRVIKAIEGLDNIEVVRSSDENVVDEIKKRARIPLENFIVVAQKNVFDLPEIARMLPESKMDKHKIFCVAMETEEMSDDSYIHLVEIFSMVFAAYADKLFYIDHPGVEHIEVICGKYYCFTPCADKLGLDRIRDIYIRQAEFLANA
jgi:hypothetical protein